MSTQTRMVAVRFSDKPGDFQLLPLDVIEAARRLHAEQAPAAPDAPAEPADDVALAALDPEPEPDAPAPRATKPIALAPTAPTAPTEAPRPWVRRQTLAIGLAGALVALALIGLGRLGSQPAPTPTVPTAASQPAAASAPTAIPTAIPTATPALPPIAAFWAPGGQRAPDLAGDVAFTPTGRYGDAWVAVDLPGGGAVWIGATDSRLDRAALLALPDRAPPPTPVPAPYVPPVVVEAPYVPEPTARPLFPLPEPTAAPQPTAVPTLPPGEGEHHGRTLPTLPPEGGAKTRTR